MYKSQNKNESNELLNIPSLCFESGNINIIKSMSGMGKTQLLNAICGQNKNYIGSIFIDNKNPIYDSSFFKIKCSYVTSDGCYISDLTVKEQFSIVSTNLVEIDELMRKLKLTQIINKKILLCSSGEKKRVEIATAILKNSPILLLDEPTANLDESNSVLIFEVLEEYAKDHLVIAASHENDLLFGNCNIYNIKNKEILPVKIQDEVQDYQSDNDYIKESSKINTRISFKYGFSKSLKNKVSFVFGFIFCFLFFCSTFFCGRLSTISQSDSLTSAIDSLPYEYTRITYDDNYISVNDDVFSCTQVAVSSSYGSLMNAICVEDLKGDLKQKCQTIFDDFVVPIQSDEKLFYHPVILTTNQQTFLKNKQLVLNVGDILPITFSNCSYAVGHSNYSDKFIIADVIDTGEEMDDDYTLSNSFPFILKRDDYISCLKHTGIRCDTINSSIKSVVKKYEEYCQAHNIEYKLNEDEFNLNNLIPYSTFTELYKKYSASNTIYENDGFVYYLGNLPEKENWVMVPYDNGSINALYDLLQTSNFFKEYVAKETIDLPLIDNFQLMNYNLLKTFSIQGLYLVNDDSLVMKDCIIVSDLLFNNLLSTISKSTKQKDFVSINISFANKSWLIENSQLILSNRSIIYKSNSLTALFNTFYNMIRLRTFSIVLCIVVSALSLFFSLIHFIGVRNSFTKDFAVLTLFGVSNAQKFKILLISMSPLIFVSYVLSVSMSNLISNSLINVIASNSGFVGKIITSNPFICYILQFLSCLILILLTFLLSELKKKKVYISTIKESK